MVKFLAQRWTAGSSPPLKPLTWFAVLLIATLLLTLAISTLTYRLIELPGQQLGRKLICRIESAPRLRPCRSRPGSVRSRSRSRPPKPATGPGVTAPVESGVSCGHAVKMTCQTYTKRERIKFQFRTLPGVGPQLLGRSRPLHRDGLLESGLEEIRGIVPGIPSRGPVGSLGHRSPFGLGQ